jgi:hypothetical protein
VERLLSTLSVFDVVAYLVSGSVLIGGLYWAFAGVPAKAPGATVVIAFAVAAYVGGQLIGALSSLARRVFSADLHPWQAEFEDGGADGRGFSDEARRRVRGALAMYGPISGAERGEIARILLAYRGADARMQLMLIGHWTASYLMMAAWLLAPCFAIALVFRSNRWQLLLAAGAAVLVGLVFRLRAKQYMRSAVAAAVYGVLALSSSPDWASRREDA